MKKKVNGFSLLELILVLAIASAVSFMKFQDLKNAQEDVQANSIGDEIKQVGEAVNSYISIKYDKLSTLTSVSTSTGSDPGPRTCDATTNTCTITYQTLINEGLLPTSFNGINSNRSAYSIILKRSGTSPNYIINGLVTTNNAWIEGSKIRYDLLGKAMQAAGVDSGMTKASSTMSGYSGTWEESSSNYSNISKTGILGYRVGYDSSMYSIYLRRDGTLPMTGNLNMGGNDIVDAANITASGTTTTDILNTTGKASVGGNLSVAGSTTMTGALQVNNSITGSGTITAGSWIWAKNGYGDSIGLGGDALTSDYEIRLSSQKPLSIYSPGSNDFNILQVHGNASLDGKIATNGLSPTNLPSGWGGGVRTLDLYASGTIGAGDSSGNIKSYINSSGNIYASGTVVADGTVSGSYLIPTTTATVGASCSKNGEISKDSTGSTLSCISGVWAKQSYTFTTYKVEYDASSAGNSTTLYQTKTLGSHVFCFLSGNQSAGGDPTVTKHVVVTVSNGIWTLQQRVTQWGAGLVTWAVATCAD